MLDRAAQALRWLTRASHDLKIAKRGLPAEDAADTIAILLHETSEKALKSFLIFHGWRLKKTHDLVALVDTAAEFDSSFRQYLEMARQLNGYYLRARYPTDVLPELTETEIQPVFKRVENLFDIVTKAVKR